MSGTVGSYQKLSLSSLETLPLHSVVAAIRFQSLCLMDFRGFEDARL
jgi:hypothetical protein